MHPYIQTHKDRFLSELFELLRIPSVSADSKHKGDLRKAAEFIKEKLLNAGVDKAELCETAGFPIVYGEKIIDKNLPTVLVYGHYDVQPADPLNLWLSPPFEPQIRDGKIFARGACDDKGQMYMHIKSLEMMLQTTGLPCNVKFMIEGEEEGAEGAVEQEEDQEGDNTDAEVVDEDLGTQCPTSAAALQFLQSTLRQDDEVDPR